MGGSFGRSWRVREWVCRWRLGGLETWRLLEVLVRFGAPGTPSDGFFLLTGVAVVVKRDAAGRRFGGGVELWGRGSNCDWDLQLRLRLRLQLDCDCDCNSTAAATTTASRFRSASPRGKVAADCASVLRRVCVFRCGARASSRQQSGKQSAYYRRKKGEMTGCDLQRQRNTEATANGSADMGYNVCLPWKDKSESCVGLGTWSEDVDDGDMGTDQWDGGVFLLY